MERTGPAHFGDGLKKGDDTVHNPYEFYLLEDLAERFPETWAERKSIWAAARRAPSPATWDVRQVHGLERDGSGRLIRYSSRWQP